jgi:tetratricopeptide (TPR) repeat protein
LHNESEKALPLAQKAVEEAPQDFDLRMFYGRLLKEKKDYIGAGREFLAAAERKPDAVKAWNEYVTMMTLTDNYPQALAALDRVRALGAENAGDLFFRAIILDKLKDYKPALEAYRKFLDAAQGKYPDQEFQARQRARIIQNILNKR